VKVSHHAWHEGRWEERPLHDSPAFFPA
jgi:hypothetical protein